MPKAMTLQQALESGRAKFAYDCAKEAADDKKVKDSEYKSYVKKIPMLIKTNGLGSTFAFVNAKGGAAYNLIYEQTKDWLIADNKGLIDLSNNSDLVQKIISLDSASYRAVTVEVLAFFTWLRRFADGLIND